MTSRQYKALKSLMWDYNIPVEDLEMLVTGKAEKAGHYTLETLFVKMASGLPWFTVIEILGPEKVRKLLTDDVIKKIWPESIRKKYKYVRKRLQEALPESK